MREVAVAVVAVAVDTVVVGEEHLCMLAVVASAAVGRAAQGRSLHEDLCIALVLVDNQDAVVDAVFEAGNQQFALVHGACLEVVPPAVACLVVVRLVGIPGEGIP